MEKKKIERYELRLSPEVKRKAQAHAQKMGVSMASLIRKLLEEKIKQVA